MADLSKIYNTRLLELAANIPLSVRLDHADASASAHSKLCGSTIEIDICMTDGKVSAFGQKVKACLLGQAAASVVARNIIGTSACEIRQVAKTMRAMLKENGPKPEGRWADLRLLEAVRDYPARHTSTMLVFDALESAFQKIEAKGAGKETAQDVRTALESPVRRQSVS